MPKPSLYENCARGFILLIPGLALFCLVQHFVHLLSQTYLNGPDAYYYGLQIRFFVEDGALKIPDTSPLLYLMGLTGRLGIGYFQTVILWMIFIQFLAAMSVCMAHRLIRGRGAFSPVPVILLTWFVLSPVLAFTCIEFPKYAFAAVFLPLWPVGVLNKKYAWVSVLTVLLSMSSHLTLVAVFLLTFAGLILHWLQTHVRLFRADFWRQKKAVPLSLLFLGLIILGFIVFYQQIFSNLQRIQFNNLQPIWLTFFSRHGIPLILKLEFGLSLLLGVLVLVLGFRSNSSAKIVSCFWSPFIFFILFIPLGSQEVMGIPERLCLMIPLIAGSTLSACRFESNAWLPKLSFALAAFLLGVTALFPGTYQNLVHPQSLNPDYAIYDQVTQRISSQEIPMLIAHQGLNYYYKFQTKRESFPYEPETHWPKAKIWRIVYGVTPSQWAYYLPERFLWGNGLLFRLAGPYSLIREDGWNIFRDQVAHSEDEELKELVYHSWLNPSQKRPEFARGRSKNDTTGDFSAYPGK